MSLHFRKRTPLLCRAALFVFSLKSEAMGDDDKSAPFLTMPYVDYIRGLDRVEVSEAGLAHWWRAIGELHVAIGPACNSVAEACLTAEAADAALQAVCHAVDRVGAVFDSHPGLAWHDATRSTVMYVTFHTLGPRLVMGSALAVAMARAVARGRHGRMGQHRRYDRTWASAVFPCGPNLVSFHDAQAALRVRDEDQLLALVLLGS